MRKKYLTFVLIPILSSCGFFGYGNRSGDMLPKGPKPLTIKDILGELDAIQYPY